VRLREGRRGDGGIQSNSEVHLRIQIGPSSPEANSRAAATLSRTKSALAGRRGRASDHVRGGEDEE
jgi:hypothetical protein